ncbi:MAG: TonB-dependent receptor [Acidobacteria bacterium]|nr:TonB-dependent receptor [Acidobacteriota bacterium]
MPFSSAPLLTVSLPLALLAGTASAQEPDDPESTVTEEITVTAQRIEESLQDVPVSVVAVSGEELERQAILDVQGLADAAPGVVVSSQSSTTGEVSLVIRGIGSNTFGLGTESTVGYYIDGAYLPRPQGFVNPFLDLERVEILRGPQGTLWGRNSTGGAINLVTRAPEGQFKGRLFASTSDFAAPESASGQRYGLSLTGPLTEKVWARASASATTIEDATWNDHLGQGSDANDGLSFRAGLTFLPSDTLTFTLRADGTDDDSHGNFHLKPGDVSPLSLVGTLSRFYGFENPLDVHRIAANIAPLSLYEENGFSLHVDKVLSGGAANLTSISSWRDFGSNRRADVDAMPVDFVENVGEYESEWWSQEFQVSGDRDRARWIAGVYAFGEEARAATDTRSDPALFGVWLFANNPGIFLFNPADFCSLGVFAPPTLCGPAYYGAMAPFLGLPLPGTVASANVFDTVLDTSSWAGYGQVDWRLGERTTLTTGLRYTSDTKEHSQTTIDFVTFQPANETLKDSWNAVTPKLGLEFRPRDGVMVYGAVTTGYKSGGFNSISLQPSFDEETITSYEVGVKSRPARGVTFNASAFAYDYDDLQVAVLFPDRSTVENAASARIQGLDVELLLRPNPRFGFDLSFEVLDDEFREFTSQNPTDVASLLDRFVAGGTLDIATLLGAGVLLEPTDQTGKGLPRAPDFSAAAAVRYAFDLGPAGSLLARAEYQYTDDLAFDPFENFVQPSRGLLHAQLRWTAANAPLFVGLYGRNLGDEEYRLTEFFTTYTGSLRVWAPPREVGVQLGFDF